MKSLKQKLKLKGWVKTGLIIGVIYLLFIAYLMLASNRVEDLDNYGDTKNSSIVLVKESE